MSYEIAKTRLGAGTCGQTEAAGLKSTDMLEEPDLRIGGLEVWLHGQEDGDSFWLRVTARCKMISVTGSIVSVVDLGRLLAACEGLYLTLEGNEQVDFLEPYIGIGIESVGRGRFTVRITLTPDFYSEGHWFLADIDQTELAATISNCRAILDKYHS